MRRRKYFFTGQLTRLLVLTVFFVLVFGVVNAENQFSMVDTSAYPPLVASIEQYTPIEYGAIGTDVFQMKARLCELGYLSDDELSDVYDDATTVSVVLFQKENGLSVTGTADSTTLALLFSEFAVANVESLSPVTAATENQDVYTYILNTNTKKFHYEYCSSVDQMKEKNKKTFVGSRDEVIAKGYDPCGRCKP